MKINWIEDCYYVYLPKEKIEIDYKDRDLLVQYIKKIIVSLKVFYDIELQGFYHVYVYIQDKYGIVLKIACIEDIDLDTIDLKIIIKNNIDFYFKTEDYFIFKDHAILHENCYYKNLNLIENIYSYLENCELYIDEEDKIKKT